MKGAWAEDRALKLLQERGLEILARNYRLPGAEIDLIARDGETIVFVEVKQRSSSRYGAPGEHLSVRQIERVRKAALVYLLAHFGSEDFPCRFDAVLIEGTLLKHSIEWVCDAF